MFGYSVDNDIRYLDGDFQRYKLEPFKYKVCDIQIIMNHYLEKKEKYMSLQDAFKKYCSISEFIKLEPHLSRDDAYMTMRVLQEMLRQLELSVEQVIELHPDSCIDANEYLEEYHEKQKHREIIREENHENHILWNSFYRSYEALLEKEESIGKICTVSKRIIENREVLLTVMDYIKEAELIPSKKSKGSNFMIVLDEEDKKRMIGIFSRPYEGEYILYSEIKKTVKS